MDERPFDLVLFGATGFTGRLVAEALARTPSPLRWALAGRSESKLREVRETLARTSAEHASLPLLVADAGDASALADVARKTRVVCTTVGPYAKYGGPLVGACAEAGTDYCDLTGEVPFIRATIDAHHERACKTGARIVHCCGFDSIPSDLGVLALHDHLKRSGRSLSRAKLVVDSVKGGFSGGTVHSLLTVMEQARHSPERRALLGDPYALVPDRARDRGLDRGDQRGVALDRDIGRWTAPFVMAAINTRIVRRSNALLGWAYGRDFRYSEVTGLSKGPRGALVGGALSVGLGAFVALAAFDTTRPLLARVLPKPGEGPSAETRARGSFKIRVYGTAAGESAPSIVCRVEGDGDPGYAATSRMLSQAALLLVETSRGAKQGGVLTPASALGLPLVERLRRVGVRFDVVDARGTA